MKFERREYLERTREKEDWQIDVLFTRRKKKGWRRNRSRETDRYGKGKGEEIFNNGKGWDRDERKKKKFDEREVEENKREKGVKGEKKDWAFGDAFHSFAIKPWLPLFAI